MIYLKQADSWCERLPLSGTCGVCESILFYIGFRQQLHENITPERWPVFEQSRQEYSSNGNPRAQAYFYGSNEEYTLMGKIDYKPNRLVIYPGTLLHSGLIDSSQTLSDSPVDGRLTVNVFAGVP